MVETKEAASCWTEKEMQVFFRLYLGSQGNLHLKYVIYNNKKCFFIGIYPKILESKMYQVQI